MDRAKVIKAAILTILMVALISGYYSYLTSRNSANNSQNGSEKNPQEVTVVQELIARDSYKEYPQTPVQVVKYYNEITACFYNEEYTDDELIALAKMARNLYDQELVDNQSFDAYLDKLKTDIRVFNEGNITIYSSEVSASTDVEFFTHDGYECAKLNVIYTLKSGTNYQTTKEVYILRKDEAGHWKIYGFALAEE